jgi:hypothetical protein
MTELQWIPVASFSAQFEADIAVARLEAAGLIAIARGNDIVGIFGPGFGGASARGVEVLVPTDSFEAAREILASPVD